MPNKDRQQPEAGYENRYFNLGKNHATLLVAGFQPGQPGGT
jgi:hypothetical protein